MNASVNTLPAAAANSQALWAAVGVLGVAVVALGASLVYVQSRPIDGHAALAALHSVPAGTSAASNTARVPVSESLAPQEDRVAPPAPVAVSRPQPVKVPKPVARPVTVTEQAPVAAPAPQDAMAQAPAPAPAPTPAPVAVAVAAGGTGAPHVFTESGPLPSQPTPVAQRAICAHCGTVEAVTPVQRAPKSGSGVGALAGGALGAVVGNQIGKGGGRALATMLGAVGGGLAGNAIEKTMKKETIYQVQVRMEDGSLRTLEQSSPATVGARVTLEGGTLHPAEQRAAAPVPALPRQTVPAGPLPGTGERA